MLQLDGSYGFCCIFAVLVKGAGQVGHVCAVK